MTSVSDGSSVRILDGGMGKELLRMGAPFRQPEWSALALMDDPATVLEAHRAFIAAGAEIIITNAYAVVPYHLGDERFAARGPELARLAAELARQAADGAEASVIVAGSLPPLFGSYEPWDYRPDDGPAVLDKLVSAQADDVDVWLAETVSSIAEAIATLDAVQRGPGTDDVWLSFCLRNYPVGPGAALVSGESLVDAVAATIEHVSGILFNCCSPDVIEPAVEEVVGLMAEQGRPVEIGAYANAFVPPPTDDHYKANEHLLEHRDDLTPQTYADLTERWVAAGASIVGGCCGIYPEHIGEIAARRRARPSAAITRSGE